MISVVLTVLKMIGILVLAVLGIVLAVLLLVLFVPVRYRADGSFQDGSIRAKAQAAWLLHAVSARVAFDQGQPLHYAVRLFGIPVLDDRRAERKKKGHKKTGSAKTDTGRVGEIRAASLEDIPDSDMDQEMEDGISPGSLDWEEAQAPDSCFGTKPEDKGRKAGDLFQKIKHLFTIFVNFFKNIKFTFQKICDTIGKIKDNIRYYLRLLQLDTTKRAFSKCKKQLLRVLKRTAPKKFRADLHLGFEDPATMGEVLAVWGMSYPLHQGNINIEPEFDRAVMEGEISLKGRVNVYVFVWAAFILFFDQDIRRSVRRFRRDMP